MHEQAARIRSYFDAAAVEYASGREHEYSFTQQKRIALKLLPSRMARVLDIGCGPAVMGTELLERAEAFWGIDISAEMIAKGRARMERHPRGAHCHLAVGDGEALDFQDGFFDAVVSLGMLEYLVTYQRALAEMWRVLRPGGVAVVAVPNRRSAYHLSRRAVGAVRRGVKRLLRRAPRATEDFVYNPCVPAGLDAEIARAGFRKAEGRCCNFIFYPLHDLHPGASLALNRRLGSIAKPPLDAWLGTQYLVKAVKPG
ncbi:MAG TPA: class I SAM-dependent methyltransferase [Burkholderiales bacterium]|nr:class I SAM-dependent methyltransferase [Burkholderiales bacterium]